MIELNKKEMGSRIKQAMKESEVTPAYLASVLGISGVSISQWRSGVKTPGINNLLALAEITSKPVEYFLPYTGSVRGSEK